MSLYLHVLLAFVSGVVIEALYALGVIFIGERKGAVAAAMSVVWGAAFLLGVNESFKTWIAAVLWCVGLGVGTLIGVWLKPKSAEDDLEERVKELEGIVDRLESFADPMRSRERAARKKSKS